MGGAHAGLNLATQPPAIILMAGLQGAGKTTTTGKLAKLLSERMKKKVMVVSTDVYRPAAIAQLQTVAQQAGSSSSVHADQKPVDIALAAVDYARRHYMDVLLVDTAGRLAIDQAMMEEIQALHAAVKPIETLFVVDAMLGQDAVNTARAFNDALPLTGVVLTKLDGDARGGAALSVRHVTGKPLKFAGVGEKLAGLEEFHPERMASRILGMGDILSLVEDARRGVDEEKAKEFAQKLKSGKGFDLNDFKDQLGQMKKMGGLTSLMDKLPAQFAQAAGQLQGGVEEKAVKRIEGIINSMTPAERAKPELLKASQAPHRRGLRGDGAGGQPPAQPVRADPEDDEAVLEGGMQKMMRAMKGMMPGGGLR
jgi:signal recognition particle subunit SRP54